ncbi:MAG: non-canonical purine NTP pyrophosphatase [Bacteroidia bacterium]
MKRFIISKVVFTAELQEEKKVLVALVTISFIFIPDNFDKTFAEMTSDEKNKISHRYLALQKMMQFLKETKYLITD